MAIISHLIEGAKITETSEGYTHTAVFILDDVAGDGQQQLWNALQDPRIPRMGDPHAAVPGITVTERNGEPIDDGQVRIEIQYGVAAGSRAPVFDLQTASVSNSFAKPEGQISISSTVVSQETSLDAHGSPLVVIYAPTKDAKGNNLTTPPKAQEQVAKLEVQRPQLVISFSRRERQSPVDLAVAYVGTVNRGFMGTLYAPETLLCTRIDGNSDDAGATFNVTYEFQYSPDTWIQNVTFEDTNTGRPPPDIDFAKASLVSDAAGGLFGFADLLAVGNGVAKYRIYLPADFEPMRLPW